MERSQRRHEGIEDERFKKKDTDGGKPRAGSGHDREEQLEKVKWKGR